MFKWLRKNEQGSVMVIVAISLAALLGISGLAVDFGGMAITKQELQNAADAAALAAGLDIMNQQGQTSATGTAREFAQVNGFTHGDGDSTVEVSYGTETVTVEITTKQDTPLAGAMTGKKSTEITAKATARITSAVGGFPYALFAAEEAKDGGDGIYVNGNNVYVNGNMHSNSEINMGSAQVVGSATAVDKLPNVGSITNGTLSQSVVKPMPDCSGLIDMVKSNCFYVDDDLTIKKNKYSFQDLIEDAIEYFQKNGGIPSEGLNIYINGNLTENGNGSSSYACPYPVNLVVKGNVTLNGAELSSSEKCPMLLITEGEHGITVNGGGAEFHGVIFAPNGDVTLHGNSATYIGSIIAQNISKTGGKITVTYSEYVDFNLPDGRVYLID